MLPSRWLIFFLLSIIAPAAWADDAPRAYPLKNGQNYIHSDVAQLALPFHLYDGNDAAVLTLDLKGLHYQGEILCRWQTRTADTESRLIDVDQLDIAQAFNSTFDPACPADVPVIATWGDGGVGAATLFLHYVRKNGSRYEVEFQGRKLHFLRSELPKNIQEYQYYETLQAY